MGHVSPMDELRSATKFWFENLSGRNHLKDLGTDGSLQC